MNEKEALLSDVELEAGHIVARPRWCTDAECRAVESQADDVGSACCGLYVWVGSPESSRVRLCIKNVDDEEPYSVGQHSEAWLDTVSLVTRAMSRLLDFWGRVDEKENT